MGDFFDCPHCGASVAVGAAACPECGSDETTGWSDEDDWGGSDGYDIAPGSTATSSDGWRRYLVPMVVAILITAVLATLSRWGVILGIPLVLLALVVTYLRSRSDGVDQTMAATEIHQALLRKARGDAALVERLIDYELERNPRASRRELMRDALDRWQRDGR